MRIIAPKFGGPYRMSGKQGKNDANDAAAICEAAGRPSMRFVPAKTVEQQALFSVHRVRHARRLMSLRGVGPVGASAIVATIGATHEFSNGRQFAAWLGMVPRQYNSGGKPRRRLGRITKAGDAYLRTLLIMGEA